MGNRTRWCKSCFFSLNTLANCSNRAFSTIKGIVTQDSVIDGVLQGKTPSKSPSSQFASVQFRQVKSDVQLAQVARILQSDPLIAVVTGNADHYGRLTLERVEITLSLFFATYLDASNGQKETFLGMVSKLDFLQFISEKNPMWSWSPRWTC